MNIEYLYDLNSVPTKYKKDDLKFVIDRSSEWVNVFGQYLHNVPFIPRKGDLVFSQGYYWNVNDVCFEPVANRVLITVSINITRTETYLSIKEVQKSNV